MLGARDAAEGEPIKEKSKRLLPWSTAPAQLLNACGSNHLNDTPIDQFWRALSDGNKAAHYFYEGVDEAPERQAIGVSRACSAIQDFIEKMVQGGTLDNFVVKDMLSKIKKEATELLPHVRTLNAAGIPVPGAETKQSERNLLFKRRRTDVNVPQPEQIETAAGALFDWVQKKPSMLKYAMMMFGGDGIPRNAQVYEKCLRAQISQKTIAREGFVAMMKCRFQGVPTNAAGSHRSDLSEFKEQ